MIRVPPFVGNDLFCDSDAQDPLLWDGECSNRCCSFNDPPWFYKQVSVDPVNDDIEMRVCRDQGRGDEDIRVQIINIFVQ